MKKIPSSGHLVSQSNRPISNKLFTDPAVAFLWLPLPSFDHIPSDTWLGPGRSFPNLTRAVLGGSLRRQQLGVSNVHDYALWKVKIVMWPWTLRLNRLIIAWLASWAKDEDNTLTRPSGGGRFQCKPLNIYTYIRWETSVFSNVKTQMLTMLIQIGGMEKNTCHTCVLFWWMNLGKKVVALGSLQTFGSTDPWAGHYKDLLFASKLRNSVHLVLVGDWGVQKLFWSNWKPRSEGFRPLSLLGRILKHMGLRKMTLQEVSGVCNLDFNSQKYTVEYNETVYICLLKNRTDQLTWNISQLHINLYTVFNWFAGFLPRRGKTSLSTFWSWSSRR